MASALVIAEKTRKIDVDNRLSLRFYYRTASNLLKQASVYRDERNVIDLYILLLRFSSLVSETIPYHRDYRAANPREKTEYTKKLKNVLGELEILKPEVQKQVDRLNKVHLVPTSSASETEWDDFTTQWPSAPRKPVRLEEDANKELFSLGVRQYHDPIPSGQNNLSSLPDKNINGDLHRSLNNLSLSIPRPKDETLSRHSPFVTNISRRQPSVAPVRPHYPNYVDASPIEMPSLEQNWRTSSQQHMVSNGSSSLHSLAEPVLWPEADNYTPVIGPNLAPAPSLIRQPDPPPMAASVQMLESLDYPGHQLPPERVADPRPGSPQDVTKGFEQEEGTKHLHISTRMMDEFLALAKLNTQRNLETCGVLAGFLKKGVFYVSALIIPKQESTSDSCQTINEEEIFDVQDKRGLFQLGWIHTHPTQTCFMSSVDLHTHYSYQVMLHEAIAVVMAPTDTQRKYGIFRLSEPGGIKSIRQCDQRGFHPHEALEDGGPIYEHSGHVFMSPKLRFDVIDLRQD